MEARSDTPAPSGGFLGLGKLFGAPAAAKPTVEEAMKAAPRGNSTPSVRPTPSMSSIFLDEGSPSPAGRRSGGGGGGRDASTPSISLYLDMASTILSRSDEIHTWVPEGCAACGAAKCALRCSHCKSAWYCNHNCQRTHWAQHKQMCERIRASCTASSDSSTSGSRASSWSGPVAKSIMSEQCFASTEGVRQHNSKLAEETRQAAEDGREFQRARHERFLEKQQARIAAFKRGEHEKKVAREERDEAKRRVGVESRESQLAAWQRVQTNRKEVVKVNVTSVVEERRVTKAESAVRKDEKRRHEIEMRQQEQEERQRHRADTFAVIREQEQRRREHTAHVRYETRPEVRAETREIFQARRDALCAAERARQNDDRQKMANHELDFLARAFELRDNVLNTVLGAQEAARTLVIDRKQDADEMRQLLEAEDERKRERCARVDQYVKANHDAVIHSRHDPSWSPMSSTPASPASRTTSPEFQRSLRVRSRSVPSVL